MSSEELRYVIPTLGESKLNKGGRRRVYLEKDQKTGLLRPVPATAGLIRTTP